MIEAILFDMDGVLVDSEPAHFAVTVEAMQAFNIPVPDDEGWASIFLGRPDRDGFTEWFLQHRVGVAVETVMADKLARMERRFREIVTPFEDGQWLARELHARGVRMALVTGARRAEANLVLRHFDLEHVFEASVSADDVTTGKPDPQPYLLGAAALGVAPQRCLVIEDSIVGLRAAEAAGAAVIVVDRLNEPDRFITQRPVAHLNDDVLHDIVSRMDNERLAKRQRRK
jgi:HAD superfamily hydrolase (TIGR01509 family)